MEFRCEDDQDKARNEREVLKQLGVKLVNPGIIGPYGPSLVPSLSNLPFYRVIPENFSKNWEIVNSRIR